jgi:hypothetical protein
MATDLLNPCIDHCALLASSSLRSNTDAQHQREGRAMLGTLHNVSRHERGPTYQVEVQKNFMNCAAHNPAATATPTRALQRQSVRS